MKKYEVSITFSKEEVDRINRLLLIDNMENMTDAELLAAGANTNHREGVFYVGFEDGSSINFDLCSGCYNYWDDIVWTSTDGRTEITLDCDYELNDIELETDDGIYVVHIITEINSWD